MLQMIVFVYIQRELTKKILFFGSLFALIKLI